ncbi:hypothetical protein D3C85_1026880 [compost metagenome]
MGVDQGAEHVVGGGDDFGAGLGLQLRDGEFDQVTRQFGTAPRRYIGRTRSGAGDLSGSLVEAALAGLDGAETGAEGNTLDFHGGYRWREGDAGN